MAIGTVLMVDGGHLNAVRRQFANDHADIFTYTDAEGNRRLRGIDMGAFRDWCLSGGNDARLVEPPIFYDGRPSFSAPLPDEPGWIWAQRAWTDQERADRERESLQLQERNRFHHAIAHRHGYQVRLGRVVRRPVQGAAEGTFFPPSQKEVDTQIAVDMVDLVWRHPDVKQIILVSADSDLRRPVLYVRHPELLAGPGPEPPMQRRRSGVTSPQPRRVILVHGPEPHYGSYQGIITACDQAICMDVRVIQGLLQRGKK